MRFRYALTTCYMPSVHRVRLLKPVIRCFLGDNNIVNMAFTHSGSGHFYKARLFPQVGKTATATVPHAGSQPADQLINIGFERSPVGNAADDSLRYQLVRIILILLVISVLTAFFHCLDGTHAPINLIAAPLIKYLFTRTFFGTGEQPTDHD